MSTTVDPTLRKLNDCGCCEGISVETPLGVSNRPGLSAIAYRVGTHPQFKESMLGRLSGLKLPAIQRLTARYDDDFSIALLDAFATVADVFTFYQERIANEAYLRTATERRSILELARLIDYQLRPGVAANTYLAFTVEDAPGAMGQAFSPGSAQIEQETVRPIAVNVGIKVQSIPGPGQQAQMFETVEEIEARPEWNAIKPRPTQPQLLSVLMHNVYLQGATLNIKQGDQILIVTITGNKSLKTVEKITIDEKAGTMRMDLVSTQPPPAPPPSKTFPPGKVSDFLIKTDLNQNAVNKIIGASWSEADLSTVLSIQGWSARQLRASIQKHFATKATPSPDVGVFVFRQRAAIFGYNAPLFTSLPGNLSHSTLLRSAITFPSPVIQAAYPNSWENQSIVEDSQGDGAQCSIYLDNSYPAIIKGSWIALSGPSLQDVRKVIDNREVIRTAFTMSAKVSRIRIENCRPLASFTIRQTIVFGQSEQLPLAETPIETIVEKNIIQLDGPYIGLRTGQKLIVTGERADLRGVIESEVAFIKNVTLEGGFTVLSLESSLAFKYVRSTVNINANVALATHGETIRDDPNGLGEALGNGDATQSFQRFALRQPPLTYTSASTPSGGETTLKVRVNDILWHEVASFFGHGPQERIYVTRTDDDSKTTVIFGDGKTGARLPTGQENIRAKYRKGIGLPGLVRANQLTLLMTPTLGLKSVTNPLAPSGAADPEKLADARRNAPLTILTLDRVVSLQDYQDFARAFGGIAKALATWTWFGQLRGIFLTVAGANGARVDKNLSERLLAAIHNVGDPAVRIQTASYEPRFFRITGGVRVHPDHLPEKVMAEIEKQLRQNFSFDAREFGQPVQLSEVMLLIQNVAGVVAVDIDQMYRTDKDAKPNPRIEAEHPRSGGENLLAAELLLLDPGPIDLKVIL